MADPSSHPDERAGVPPQNDSPLPAPSGSPTGVPGGGRGAAADGSVFTEVPRRTVLSSIREQWREWRHPEALPPLELQSKPVPVQSIWSKREGFWGNGGSLLVHVIVILLLVLPIFHPKVRQALQSDFHQVEITFVTPPSPHRMGGGGGQRSIHPISAGRMPKLARNPIALPTPPQIQPPLPAPPKLEMQPVKVAQINLPQFGNPVATIAPPSGGGGTGGGLGPGNGGGFGPGNGGNAGGGDEAYGAGDLTKPVPIYAPDPEYSDAARKARYQGTVVLQALIGVDGMAHDIKVVQPLGLGLDEKAIEALKLWKFTPAKKRNGQSIATLADVSVTFRLY